MNVTADLIHRLEREALARAIWHEERVRRLMRLYGHTRREAEEIEAAAEGIIAEMHEEELAAERSAAGGSDAGDWLGAVVLLALFLGVVAAVRAVL